MSLNRYGGDCLVSPRLVAVSGPLAGKSFTLVARPVRLGRDYANDLHLRDLAVSRQHCVIEPLEEGFSVRDLGSRHGTYVNGVPVRDRRLEDGDLVSRLLLDRLRETGGVIALALGREHDVSALEVRLHVRVAERLHDLTQSRHRDPLVRADVDPAQQGGDAHHSNLLGGR